jgi:hypothetical protein
MVFFSHDCGPERPGKFPNVFAVAGCFVKCRQFSMDPANGPYIKKEESNPQNKHRKIFAF